MASPDFALRLRPLRFSVFRVPAFRHILPLTKAISCLAMGIRR